MNSSSEDRNAAQGMHELFSRLIRSVDQTTLAEISEIVERYPELAGQISAMFPDRLPMEELSESSAGATGSRRSITPRPWAHSATARRLPDPAGNDNEARRNFGLDWRDPNLSRIRRRCP